MPLNQALEIAAELRVLRDTLKQRQDELADVNTRRSALQNEIAGLQTAIAAKRADLRNASSDL